MAINIKFDLAGNPEPPTILLANRNGNILGQLDVDTDSIDLGDKFNDASELSFTLNKYIDGKLTNLWDKVVDFKLVYCKEWGEWFEITVELDEATETIKTIMCTQLGQAELSQIMLYNIEINTEADIERDDYKISILYDVDQPEASILHRLLKDKAPHYSIAYVSPTIAKIQRSFSFDGTSICDALQEIAEEIGCLFQFHAGIDENGVLQRKIAVYDLQQTCNDCGHRGEFTDKCPKCNSANITNGYGEDTLIFITADELASEGIELTTHTDSVKNCFKLEAGDDLMTATVRNCNPNGTDYIWYFSDNMKEDMSEELVAKLESYDAQYEQYYRKNTAHLDTKLLGEFNSLVDKYSVYNENLQKITSPIVGYPALMNAHYNTIDMALYLESGLMPSVEMSETSAEEQVKLLTSSSLSPVAVNVEKLDSVSLATANSAVLSMAKLIIRPTYKVEIKTSALSADKKVWSGQFIVTNYSDDEDVATSGTISVTINNDTETFAKQKIEKALNKENTDDLSISGLFDEEKYNYNEFCAELKKYALNPLKGFYDACDACLNILIDQGAGNKDEKPDLYTSLYVPYYKKSSAIAAEIKCREDEIAIIKELQTDIEEHRNAIQSELNFEKYLGENLWLEFCAYRREDKYSNDNYISDGLNNAEIFKKASEFFEVAENEIFKSAELQHSISTTLNNLLAIPKFKPLVDSFKTGNWIRVQVDDKIYKLRLLEYDISFGDFDNISVEFSDITKIKNGITDVQSVFEQASSMATSYSSIQRQANQGDKAKTTLEEWIADGLNSANVQIQSNDTEDITFTKNGLLCRSYDDITNTYSPEQLRITHNIMAYTDDNWATVRQAIGKHNYKLYDKNKKDFIDKIGYGITADFVDAGIVSGSQIIGGDIYSDNYSIDDKTGSYLNLRDGTFNFGGGKITFNGTELLINPDNDLGVTESDVTRITNNLISTAEIDAKQITTGQLSAERIDTKGLIAENISATTIEGKTISGGSLFIGDKATDTYAEIDIYGKLTCNGVDIAGAITATSGTFSNCTINENCTIKGTLDGVDGTFSGDIKGATITGGSLLIGDKDNGYAAWISDEDGIFHAYGAVIEGDSTFTGTITASKIVGQSTLNLGEYTDDEGNICYYTQISKDGMLTAVNGTFTGDIYANSLTLNSDFKIGDDEDGYHTWIGTDGVLNAGGAKITGELHVTNGGAIGGFKIDGDSICHTKTAYDETVNNGVYLGTDGIGLGKGAFYVTNEGYLYAKDADIAGVVTATTGYIGYQDDDNVGWEISSNKISGGGVSLYTGEDCVEGAGTDDEKKVRISVGNETETDKLNANPFRVFHDGYVVASNGKIGSCKFYTHKYPVVGEDLADITVGHRLTATYEGLNSTPILSLNYAVRRSPSDTYSTKTFTQFAYEHTGTMMQTTSADTFIWYWAWTDSATSSPDESDWIGTGLGRNFSDMDTSIIQTKPHLWFKCYLQKYEAEGNVDIGTAIYYINDFSGYATIFSFGDEGSLRMGENIITGKTSSIKFEDNCGRLSGTWYCGDGDTVITSWRGAKSHIEELDDRYSVLFDTLQPVRFKYNHGQSDRYHTGLILDGLKTAMDEANIDTSELAAYCISDEITGEGGIRYGEFIALCIDQIQKLKKRVVELENKQSNN